MPREWTAMKIRELVKAKFDKRPCWLQIKIALALYAKKDVVGVATGAGKTLSVWIALLMAGLEYDRQRAHLRVHLCWLQQLACSHQETPNILQHPRL